MRFRVRNLFYLRLSSSDVIPLYLYLDERHVDWMSERTLQSVIADLRPLVGPKLEVERYAHYGPGGPANAKKGTVEVHRGDSYQFAYFLRRTEAHSIVFKTRNYVMVDRAAQSSNVQAAESQEKGVGSGSRSTNGRRTNRTTKGTKRTRKAASQKKPSNKKGKGKARADDVIELTDSSREAEESPLSDLEDDSEADGTGPIVPRRSTRRKKQRTTYREVSDDEDGAGFNSNDNMNVRDEEVDVKQEVIDDDAHLHDAVVDEGIEVDDGQTDLPMGPPPLPPNFGIDEDEEEKKLKPQLQLSFRSLNMHDRCLCVVVEPWPALPTRPTPAPDQPNTPRAASVAPPHVRASFDRSESVDTSRLSVAPGAREETPLFLPDLSGRDRSATPAPIRFSSEFSALHTIDDSQDPIEDDDNFGMLAFSQALNNVSGDRIGATEDDDDMDGGALYGDADEIRGAIQ
ncbi:hypothetical protein ACEPAH_5657 [Sanghuangporus vaninii]